jgi:signal transduction histidine kinase
VSAAITDSGPGIAPEELPWLFEKYRRTEEGKKREGTGLGLFIVKSLVEAHGGRVEVESAVGAGTCFRVFLPTASVSIH